MPPQLVLLFFILFIAGLFIVDFRRKLQVSPALWIPLTWMMIIGSRFVSQWLNPGATVESPDASDLLEGSPLDRNVFLFLIVAGLFILSRRKISWSQILKSNVWVLLFFLYGGISIMWSDFPFISFKRWIKSIGMLVMVLLVLTETDSVEAIKTIVRRCAYVLIPLSVVFIIYYPDLGTSYSSWTGEVYYTGVTTTKNELGVLCLVCGIFFFANLLTIRHKRKKTSVDRMEVFIDALFLLMISWLFKMADSVTSLSCFIIGACILVWIRLRISARAKLFGSCVLFTGLLCLILQSSSDFMHTFVVGLGRDMTLTGRIDLWKDLIDMDTHPLIGSGYEIFWLGDRAEQLWAMYYWHPNQAHNGYLETYLNLGWIGLLLLIGVIISAYQKCNTKFRLEHGYGKFQMTFLTIVLLYNATEAAFHGVHLMCFSFFLVAMDIPHLSQFQTASRSHTK